MNIKILITSCALALISQAVFANDKDTLSAVTLGPLDLTGANAKVSEAKLQRLFPRYSIKYEIGYGDSPAFHYFEVASRNGEALFSVISFIKDGEKAEKTKSEVPISLVKIRSKEIPDIFGIRVGDYVKDIIAKRGKNLKFGAGHHDALIGDNGIYYSLITGGEVSPEHLTINDAIKGNWQIRFISAPEAAWE